jgi:hypothetical protein
MREFQDQRHWLSGTLLVRDTGNQKQVTKDVVIDTVVRNPVTGDVENRLSDQIITKNSHHLVWRCTLVVSATQEAEAGDLVPPPHCTKEAKNS